MPGLFEVNPFGFREARGALLRIIAKGGNLKAPFAEAGEDLIDQVHQHFRQEHDAEGNPWPALSAAYVERARGGEAHPILFVTGELYGSFAYVASEEGLAVGTNLQFDSGQSFAAIHQFGGVAGRGSYIPPRPMLGMNDEDKDHVAQLLLDYLTTL